ncbi:hypothetical protein LCGC14_1875340, partial [marine sediment metagenome]
EDTFDGPLLTPGGDVVMSPSAMVLLFVTGGYSQPTTVLALRPDPTKILKPAPTAAQGGEDTGGQGQAPHGDRTEAVRALSERPAVRCLRHQVAA